LVSSLDGRHSQIIRFYFWNKYTTNKTAEKLNVSTRTIFRKTNESLDAFADGLDSVGINTYTFNDMIKNHSWVQGVYQSLENGEQVI